METHTTVLGKLRQIFKQEHKSSCGSGCSNARFGQWLPLKQDETIQKRPDHLEQSMRIFIPLPQVLRKTDWRRTGLMTKSELQDAN
jgi:hypothetical protein